MNTTEIAKDIDAALQRFAQKPQPSTKQMQKVAPQQ